MNTRSAAAQILASLLRQKGSLSSLLPEMQVRVASRDHALLQELCYGTCRWQPRLECYLDILLDKPLRGKDQDVHALLLIGLYQLVHLRIPDHAAIGATVEAARALKKPWARALVNGVLRRFQREGDALLTRVENRREFQVAHPRWLIERIEQAWPDRADDIFAANNLHPPLTLRVNRLVSGRDDYLQELRKLGFQAQTTPFSADGITLAKAVDVDDLPAFAAGAVSVQDEAAQLCAPLLDLQPGQRVLDACCAPGGKTAHILEFRADLARVVGVDISEQRLARTRVNLERLGLTADLIVADATRPATWWDGPLFDRILVDAPCSATGVIRRHPDIKLVRRPDEVERLTRTQLAILEQSWSLLKPGGLLLYATCSILPEENDGLIAEFLEKQSDAQAENLGVAWGLERPFGRQLLPRPEGHDGFYFARLRRRG